MEALNNFGMDLENTTWWSRDGKDHFTIRDVYFNGQEIQIRTMDGRMLNGDIMQEYIQSDTPVAQPTTQPQTHINKNLLLQGLDEDNSDIFIEDTPKIGQNLNKPIPEAVSESENNIIIRRMLDKLGWPEYKIKFEFDINEDYVKKLVDMAEIMEVNLNEVCDYVMSKMETEDMIQKIKQSFQNSFTDVFGIEETPIE